MEKCISLRGLDPRLRPPLADELNDLKNKSGHCCNGVGITAYAPNMNLVHDPRW